MASREDKKDKKMLKPSVQARQLPELLKNYYGAIESQQIPPIFIDLLEKLDAAERQARGSRKVH